MTTAREWLDAAQARSDAAKRPLLASMDYRAQVALDRARKDCAYDVPALVAALTAVLDLLAAREAEHAEYVRQIKAGELVTLDRVIGPAQVKVREVQDAIDAALGTVTP